MNARALLEHGLSGLMLLDIDFSHGLAEIERLREDFPEPRILTKRVDVTDAAQVRSVVEETAEELGSVDILCCFAGVVSCAHTIEVTAEEWKRTLDINTTGAFLCAQAVARYTLSSSFLLPPPPPPKQYYSPPPAAFKSPSRSPAAYYSSRPSLPTGPTTHSRKPATTRPKPRSYP